MQASSVASERSFSSAGITISKRRNRLNADIVEALQILKSTYRKSYMKGTDVTVLENEWAMEKSSDEVEREADEVEEELNKEESEVQVLGEGEMQLAIDDDGDSDWEDI